jgi:hypothetical protein
MSTMTYGKKSKHLKINWPENLEKKISGEKNFFFCQTLIPGCENA